MTPSYVLALHCGCVVSVARHPRTGQAATRVIEHRAPDCRDRRHRQGVRFWLWEMLPSATPDPRINHEDIVAPDTNAG